jgi:hypothetical protein
MEEEMCETFPSNFDVIFGKSTGPSARKTLQARGGRRIKMAGGVCAYESSTYITMNSKMLGGS